MPVHFDWTRSRPRARWSIGPREWKSSERQSYTWRERPISLIELYTADVSAFIETIGTKQSSDTYEKSAGTVDQEHRARKALAGQLKKNQNMTRAEAHEWLKTIDIDLGKRPFARVWSEGA